ncbi:cupin domain-containing protein [bacterium]|nr:cupin domain-containing protein [bacterium]
MSNLRIYREDTPTDILRETSAGEEISSLLREHGVRFERWEAATPIADTATQEEIIEAYRAQVDQLMSEEGYQSYDVINMYQDHPEKEAFRSKFRAEHTHSEDEVRFFVKGKGLFTLHIGEEVYEVICEKNDLISVPAGIPHWFDMGNAPSFTCIRLFDSKDGWVAHYTGSPIASEFSALETTG